jgi:hypothetical protein
MLSKETGGTVVRVRRSSDNTEQDFTAKQIDSGALETWVGAGNDGFVTTWYDQSGNGNDATQATASSQPKIVDTGALVTENGKAALDFDGVDDGLIVPDVETKSIYAIFTQNGDDDFLSPVRNRVYLHSGSFVVQKTTPDINIPLLTNYVDGRDILLSYNNNTTDTLSINRDRYSDLDAPNESFFINRIGKNENSSSTLPTNPPTAHKLSPTSTTTTRYSDVLHRHSRTMRSLQR